MPAEIQYSLAIFLCIYFFPWIVALLRKHNTVGVFIINLLFGWTILGWVVALVMACGNNKVVVMVQPK